MRISRLKVHNSVKPQDDQWHYNFEPKKVSNNLDSIQKWQNK